MLSVIIMTREFNPESMFGKHSFITEQFFAAAWDGHMSDAVFFIDQNISRQFGDVKPWFLSELIPLERRRHLVQKNLDKALDSLKAVGVV